MNIFVAKKYIYDDASFPLCLPRINEIKIPHPTFDKDDRPLTWQLETSVAKSWNVRVPLFKRTLSTFHAL